MFFKALTLFRFPPTLVFDQLDALLADCVLKPVGPLELGSRGFVAPFGVGHDALSHRCNDAIWLTVGGEDRILPEAVVNKALAEKIEAVFTSQRRRPGGRARQRLRDDLVHELLPRAFVKPSRTDAMLDLEHGYIAVNTSSRQAGENFVSEVRRALGSFPALPLNAEVAPRSVLTGWIAGEPMPEGLALGEDCNLEDPIDGGSAVKCYRLDLLHSEEIAEHLRAGRQCTRLALTMDDCLAFDLDERLVVRKLKFLDGALDALENDERDTLQAELDARFALMSGLVRRLFVVLEGAMKISKVES